MRFDFKLIDADQVTTSNRIYPKETIQQLYQKYKGKKVPIIMGQDNCLEIASINKTIGFADLKLKDGNLRFNGYFLKSPKFEWWKFWSWNFYFQQKRLYNLKMKVAINGVQKGKYRFTPRSLGVFKKNNNGINIVEDIKLISIDAVLKDENPI